MTYTPLAARKNDTDDISVSLTAHKDHYHVTVILRLIYGPQAYMITIDDLNAAQHHYNEWADFLDCSYTLTSDELEQADRWAKNMGAN